MPNQNYPGHALNICFAFGWMYGWEVVALGVFVRGFLPKNARIVNVGAGVGTSGLAMAEALPDAEITTVDISAGGPGGGLENERNAFKDTELRLPFQLQGDSPVVARSFKGTVDFICIDADHSYSSVVADIRAWRPHVKTNGYMAFHDYQPGIWGDVVRAVDEEMKDCEQLFVIDTMAFYRVP